MGILAGAGKEATEILDQAERDDHARERATNKKELIQRIKNCTFVPPSQDLDVQGLPPTQAVALVARDTSTNARMGAGPWYEVVYIIGGLGRRNGNEQKDYEEYEKRLSRHRFKFDMSAERGNEMCNNSRDGWKEIPENLRSEILRQIAVLEKRRK